MAPLRELFQHPREGGRLADILGGDLARRAQAALVDQFTGKNLLVREALTLKLDALREELLGATPTALEKLLAERVAATWLHLHVLEMNYAGKESLSLGLGAYYQKAISAAQKRYLAAIKGLADVRRLALPVLQVNIAKKQVNIAAGIPTLQRTIALVGCGELADGTPAAGESEVTGPGKASGRAFRPSPGVRFYSRHLAMRAVRRAC